MAIWRPSPRVRASTSASVLSLFPSPRVLVPVLVPSVCFARIFLFVGVPSPLGVWGPARSGASLSRAVGRLTLAVVGSFRSIVAHMGTLRVLGLCLLPQPVRCAFSAAADHRLMMQVFGFFTIMFGVWFNSKYGEEKRRERVVDYELVPTWEVEEGLGAVVGGVAGSSGSEERERWGSRTGTDEDNENVLNRNDLEGSGDHGMWRGGALDLEMGDGGRKRGTEMSVLGKAV